MTSLFRHLLLALGLFIVFSGFSVTEANGQNVLNEILRRMDINYKSLQSMTADVTMSKHNPQLNATDVSQGNVSLLPKTAKRVMYVRLNWTKPMDEQISVIGDTYELYRSRMNQVITGKVNKASNSASAGGALGFMNMSKEQLKTSYDVVYLGEEQVQGGTATWHLQLTPKAATSYKSAELWVDKDGMPRQSKVIEQNGDSTTLLIANIQKNVTLKGDLFKLNYPKTVKKIKA
jgi:outer membrane lipoprotein-sorting protein